jgi:5-formyltetrahydrofolate cyclo-ligase
VTEAAPGSKERLRALLRERLAGMTTDERRRKSRRVSHRLKALLDDRDYDRLLLHLPLPTEVALDDLWQALDPGRPVFVPRVEGSELRFLQVVAETRWVRSALGPLEPETGEPLEPAEIARGSSVVVVPGLAFDARGGRLGRGGGHYDRFLRAVRAAGRIEAIAAAFDLQILPDVPREPHDERVDVVVTESRTLVSPREGA